MGDDDTKHSSKHKRSRDSGERDKHKSKKHHKSHRDKDERSKRKDKKDRDGSRIVDDDAADEDMWVEKNIDMDGEYVSKPATDGALDELPCVHSCLRPTYLLQIVSSSPREPQSSQMILLCRNLLPQNQLLREMIGCSSHRQPLLRQVQSRRSVHFLLKKSHSQKTMESSHAMYVQARVV